MNIFIKEEIIQDIMPFVQNQAEDYIPSGTIWMGLTKRTVMGYGNTEKKYLNTNHERIKAQKEEVIEAPMMKGGAATLEPDTFILFGFFDTEEKAQNAIKKIREKIIQFLEEHRIEGIITPRNDIIVHDKKFGGSSMTPKLKNGNYTIVWFVNNSVRNKEIRQIASVHSSGRMGIGLNEFGLNTQMLLDFLKEELK